MAAAALARLLRFPLASYLRVELRNTGMVAHAWSVAGRVTVSGGESFGSYAIVSCFAVEQ